MNIFSKIVALAAVIGFGTHQASAVPLSFTYNGDQTPSAGTYGAWFTTLGPGHPTGSYFIGTGWSSDGDVLTMRTRHPNDYLGAPSLGIWFGITGGYGDPSGLGLANTVEGNRVETRMALGANSSEWSLYWYDASGYGCGLYLMENGFFYGGGGVNNGFMPRADMNSFHTYGTHIQNGEVAFYFDGVEFARGPAATGLSNFLLLGDGSATDVTGYGTLLVDSMTITVNAGPIPVPEPTAAALIFVGAMSLAMRRRE